MPREKYKWTLAEGIKVRLGDNSYGRQRAIGAEGQLFLILHEPPKPDDRQRKESLFLREPDGEWLHCGQRKGQSALYRLLEQYREVLEKCQKQYDDSKTAETLFVVLETLNPLLKAVGNLNSALQTAHEIEAADKFIIEVRDESGDLQRNFELLMDEAKMALDFRIAQNAEAQISQAKQMAKAQHKLNLMAAITFPMMALASVFGMNLMSGLESVDNLFWLALGFGGGFGFAALKWINSDTK